MDIVHLFYRNFPFLKRILTIILKPVLFVRNMLFPRQFQVAINDKWDNGATVYFKAKLKEVLKCDNYFLKNIQDSNQFLRTNEGPLFVICLHESRIGADIDTALSGINEKYSNKVILIIIHWKQDDTEPKGSNYEYRVKKIIQYFQQNDLDNIQHIKEEIVENVIAHDSNAI